MSTRYARFLRSGTTSWSSAPTALLAIGALLFFLGAVIDGAPIAMTIAALVFAAMHFPGALTRGGKPQ